MEPIDIELIETRKARVNALKVELMSVKNSSMPSVEKAKQMGEITLMLRPELKQLNIPWHKFMSEELDISPATLYNAQRIASRWDYIKHMNPTSLRETINFMYPEDKMAEKLQRRFVATENVKVLWASC